MTRFRQRLLSPGPLKLPGDRVARLTAGDLRSLAENTHRLLQQGYRIPVLATHAAPGSVDGGPLPRLPRQGDRRVQQAGKANPQRIGWLIDLVQDRDGSLIQVIEVESPLPTTRLGSEQRFTSPEIRPAFQTAGGLRVGPVIAHVAFTRRPRCTGQTPLQIAPQQPGDFHFSNRNRGPISMSVTNDVSADSALPNDQFESSAEQPVAAGEPGQSQPAGDTEEPVEHGPTAVELPETDSAEGTPAAGDLPQGQDVSCDQLCERIRRSRKLPRGLRDRLCDAVQALQLSEESDAEPSLTIRDAIDLIEQALPEHLQLDDGQLQQPSHPAGETFFSGEAGDLSDEEADRIAAEQLASAGFAPRGA